MAKTYNVRTIRMRDPEFEGLINDLSAEFKKQVEEFENDEWNSRKKIKSPQRYILKFENGKILGAQAFVLSVGFGEGVLLTDTHYHNKGKKDYEKNLPTECSEIILFTSFDKSINEIAKVLTDGTPVEFIDRGKGYKSNPNITETPKEIKRRIGTQKVLLRPEQANFRKLLLNKYHGTCMITKCDTKESLEAAHIIPVSKKGTDSVENGLLLRADLHLLFDAGLMAIDPKTGKVHFSKDAGNHYKKYEQIKINTTIVSRETLAARWQEFNKESE